MQQSHLPATIQELYEFYDYRHASALLKTAFPDEFSDLCDALLEFRFKESYIRQAGGNESEMPKAFSKVLNPRGWKEEELVAKTVIDNVTVVRSETHKIDYVKDQVAVDFEWNSKDQTFDRDLYAFRAFFEFNKISVGVLVTRSRKLDAWFRTLGNYTDKHDVERPIYGKYGASTTHMDKLTPRLEAGRSGGCPVLALGITLGLLEPD